MKHRHVFVVSIHMDHIQPVHNKQSKGTGTMNQIYSIVSSMQKQAWDIINDTDLIGIWTSIGATINLVGSLKTGLLINNRDIDFHIYTNPFRLSDSFSAVSRLAQNRRIKSISYTNLLEDHDKCLEWHAFYNDTMGCSWQINMFHILNESPWAGYSEKVDQRISEMLTQETRRAVLEIKNAIPSQEKLTGIQVYKAVIEDGIRDVDSFWEWKKQNPEQGIIKWMP